MEDKEFEEVTRAGLQASLDECPPHLLKHVSGGVDPDARTARLSDHCSSGSASGSGGSGNGPGAGSRAVGGKVSAGVASASGGSGIKLGAIPHADGDKVSAGVVVASHGSGGGSRAASAAIPKKAPPDPSILTECSKFANDLALSRMASG